jgi:hypothetical protein
MNDMQQVTAQTGLSGLSDAEWEYAWRYGDYLVLGDEKPSPIGFNSERIAQIEIILNTQYAAHLRTIRGSRAK